MFSRQKKGVNHPRPHFRVFAFKHASHCMTKAACNFGSVSAERRRVLIEVAEPVAPRLPKVSFSLTTSRGFVCSSAPTRLLTAGRGIGGLRLNRKGRNRAPSKCEARQNTALSRRSCGGSDTSSPNQRRRLSFALLRPPQGGHLTRGNEVFVAQPIPSSYMRPCHLYRCPDLSFKAS